MAGKTGLGLAEFEKTKLGLPYVYLEGVSVNGYSFRP